MKKIRVAIICGGKSGEHEVSIASAASVFNALDKNKYDVTLLGIDKGGRWLLPSGTKSLVSSANPMLTKLKNETQTVSLVPFESKNQLVPLAPTNNQPLPTGFDVVIPILHGPYGEDGTIQGLLELANIPYVGSGVLGSALGMDKDASRRLLAAAGVPVVKYRTIRRKEFERNADQLMTEITSQFQIPFFVKPANLGSSVGVAKIKSPEEAFSKIKAAFAYDTKVLIEHGVDARELECSVLGNDEPKASVVGEVIPQHEFYSYEAKYIDENGAILKIPAENIDSGVIQAIQKYAIEAFKVLECRGLARVDFFLDRKTGELFLNEINTIPGFTKVSMYPKLWEASGLPYAALLDTLIQLAIEKHAEKNALKTSYDPSEN